MKNLLISLSLLTNLTIPLQTIVVNKIQENYVSEEATLASSNQKVENINFSFNHDKHWKDDKLVPGKKDYQNEFKSAYRNAKKKLGDLKKWEVSIVDFKGYLLHDKDTPLYLPKQSSEKMKKILFANEIKLNSVFVEINPAIYDENNPEDIGLYSYAINYSVMADEELVEDNLSAYKADDLFSENNFLEPYELSLSYFLQTDGDKIDGFDWRAISSNDDKKLDLWSWKDEDGTNNVRINIPIDKSSPEKIISFGGWGETYQIRAKQKEAKHIESTWDSSLKWVKLPSGIKVQKDFEVPLTTPNEYFIRGGLRLDSLEDPSIIFTINLDFWATKNGAVNYDRFTYQYNFSINFVSI